MYTYMPVYPPLASPSHPPFPTPLGGHKAPSWSPCAMWLLPTSYLHLVVYICPCHSQTLSQFTLPPSRVLKSILYVCIFIPVLPLGASELFSFLFFFRFHIYVLVYSICFSLTDLLHSVWHSLHPSTSLQITQFHFFLWLSNIPLYICATSSLSINLSMDT